MKLSDFKVLTFDCYGTLIDWDTGLTRAYRGLTARSRKQTTSEEVLRLHARYEADQEAQTPTLPYSQLLGVVHSRVGCDLGVETTSAEDSAFGSSIPDWPVFPDTVEALRYLKQFYKLVILSNVDRKSFEGSRALLQMEFDNVFTAQDIGSYKPNRKNFEYLISKLAADGIQKHEILHTAESLYHDHLPANEVGLASAWIHRRHEQQGFGATQPPETIPHYDFRFTSMIEMARAHQSESISL